MGAMDIEAILQAPFGATTAQTGEEEPRSRQALLAFTTAFGFPAVYGW